MNAAAPGAPRWRHPLVLVALVIVVAAIVIGGMIALNPQPGTSQVGSSASVTASVPAASGPPHRLNERVRVGDTEYLTALGVSSWPGTDFVKPPANQTFAAVEVRVEGIDPNGAAVDPFWFHLEDSESQRHDLVESGKDPGLQPNDAIAPESSAQGWLTFTITESEGKGLTLVYAPPFAAPVRISLD